MAQRSDETPGQGRERLLPEEAAVGSDDSRAQAEAILQESEERTLHPEQARRESSQTPDGA